MNPKRVHVANQKIGDILVAESSLRKTEARLPPKQRSEDLRIGFDVSLDGSFILRRCDHLFEIIDVLLGDASCEFVLGQLLALGFRPRLRPSPRLIVVSRRSPTLRALRSR